jgi:glycosyltransferase involved in cell wall biosynthesis
VSLRVAHVAPIFSTVPPQGYGGVERVIDELSSTQLSVSGVDLDVVVVASSDSRPSAPAVGRHPSIRGRVPPLSLEATFEELRRHYDWAYEVADELAVDVIHLHGPWGLEYRPASVSRPVVVSVYDDTRRRDVTDPLLSLPPQFHVVANSESSRAKAPFVPWHGVVLEGIVPTRYPFQDAKGDYCCFVGELVHDKGLDIAIEVAAAAGIELKVIGRPTMLDVAQELVDEQRAFLDRVLQPRLGRGVEYLGELGEERLAVLGGAVALLAPARHEEPFGRVSAEAMSCGTPVITFDRGSAREIIEQGVSGFYVTTSDEMVDALRRARTLDPTACRAHVVRVLNMDRVAREYSAIYRAVVHTGAHR